MQDHDIVSASQDQQHLHCQTQQNKNLVFDLSPSLSQGQYRQPNNIMDKVKSSLGKERLFIIWTMVFYWKLKHL